MRHTATRCFPFNESRRRRCQPSFSNSGEAGTDRTGVEILVCPRLLLLRSSSRYRETIQTPQRFDTQHGGELFSLNESRRLRANPASRTRRSGGPTGRVSKFWFVRGSCSSAAAAATVSSWCGSSASGVPPISFTRSQRLSGGVATRSPRCCVLHSELLSSRCCS